jgi:hypothetical protein
MVRIKGGSLLTGWAEDDSNKRTGQRKPRGRRITVPASLWPQMICSTSTPSAESLDGRGCSASCGRDGWCRSNAHHESSFPRVISMPFFDALSTVNVAQRIKSKAHVPMTVMHATVAATRRRAARSDPASRRSNWISARSISDKTRRSRAGFSSHSLTYYVSCV